MRNLSQINQEIMALTAKISVNYPELYRYLDEIPATIPTGDHLLIDCEVVEDYLSSLKEMLKQYQQTHYSD